MAGTRFLVPMLPCGNAYNKPRRGNPLKIGRSLVDSRLRGNDGETFAGMAGRPSQEWQEPMIPRSHATVWECIQQTAMGQSIKDRSLRYGFPPARE